MAKQRNEDRERAKKAVRRYVNALGNLARSWDELYASEDHGTPSPNSRAADDAERLTVWCGDKYTELDVAVVTIVSLKMAVAVDHLRSTGHLLQAKDCGLWSIWTTGRACLESLGMVRWLTEFDVDERVRLGRVINVRLDSLSGAIRLIEKSEMPSEYIQLDPRKRREEVISLAGELGFGVVGGKRPQLDPAMPDMTTFVDDLAGPGIYSLASGMAHAEVWAMVRHQRPVDIVDPSGHGRSLSDLSATVDDYRVLCLLLAHSVSEGVKHATDYLGWDRGPFDTALKRAINDFQDPV